MDKSKILKAKEYAKLYTQAEDKQECLRNIVMNLFEEGITLLKIRNAKSNSALFAIWDELENKWRAFIRKTEDDTINEAGFNLTIQKIFPEGYEAWQLYKQKLHPNKNKIDILNALIFPKAVRKS